MADSSTSSGRPERSDRPRLLGQVHEAIRRRYYSRRTEEAYVHWMKRYIYFTGNRHPASLGETEVTAFLNLYKFSNSPTPGLLSVVAV